MKKKGLVISALVFALSLLVSIPAFAGQWQNNETGWWYTEDDGSYPVNQWKWIDGNGDGISESYYFDSNGYMLVNTTTPDGYTVNSDGAWVVDGVVQTQGVSNTQTANTDTTQSASLNQEYIDMFGKDINYVLSKMGTGYDQGYLENVCGYRYATSNGSVAIFFDIPTDKYVNELVIDESALFNGSHGLTVSELNAILGTEMYTDGYSQYWSLGGSPEIIVKRVEGGNGFQVYYAGLY